MARLNKSVKGNGSPNITVNHEGSKAYKLTPKMELYSAVVTSTLSNSFYESSNSTLKRIQDLIQKVDHEFVAKLAVYAREHMYLRTIPLILSVELAKVHSGDTLVSRLVERVIQRADEITEILGYYQQANSRDGQKKLAKLSNQIKKGVANSFYKFSEYQLSKYNRANEIKLRDALFLTHPKPLDDEMEELFKKIANDTLSTAETWEVELSKGGDKKASWEKMIDSEKMGYMATLRNLRNILEADVSKEHINKVIKFLTNQKAVENSKQLPFRFLAAYRELCGVFDPYRSRHDIKYSPSLSKGAILDALEVAVKLSSKNLPFNERDSILIASDVSSSMFDTVSEKSSIRRYDIGLLMSMTLQNKCRYVVPGVFGDKWMTMNLPKTNILQNVNDLYKKEGCVGYSTNGFKVLEWALKQDEIFDKIMMFTDCQLYDSRGYSRDSHLPELWNMYLKKNPNAKLYLFDLAGYGTTPIQLNKNNIFMISGFSDKIWDILNALENGGNALEEVEKIKI